MKKQWNTILILLFSLLIVIFSVLNVESVDVNFGFQTLNIPLVVVIIGSLSIGVLMTVIISATSLLQNNSKYKKLEKEIESLEERNKHQRMMLKEELEKEKNLLLKQNKEKEQEIRVLKNKINSTVANEYSQNNDD